MAKTALQILKEDKENAARYAEQASKGSARRMLERAQRELNERLKNVRASGLKDDTFTVHQIQATLAQVRAVLVPLVQEMRTAAVSIGKETAAHAAADAVDYVSRAEQEFRGSSAPLPFNTASMIDTAVRGSESTVLRRIDSNPHHPGKPGVLARYGTNVIGKFEQTLQQRLIQGKPWAQAKADLIADSPFLQQQPAFWAERILRTESMNAHNAASQQTLQQVEAIVGPMLKILAATFDDRTGADSYAVHGQIRRTTEAFQSWFGAYMHPPNRPNDREIVVPHNQSWPLPPSLKWLSDSAVAARWAHEGRKGSPPARPLMTTVPLEDMGKPAPPMAQAAPAAPALTPAVPVEQQSAALAPPALAPPPQASSVVYSLPAAEPLPPSPPPLPPPVELPAPEPFAPPPPIQVASPEPALPPLPSENILGKKITGALGSNPGGVYEGLDGKKRYVKFYSDRAQAAGEHLANKVYEALGLGSLKSETFVVHGDRDHNGKLAYASEMVEGAKTLGSSPTIDPKLAKKALDGFAADVLLANWDAAGLSLDNLIVGPGKKVMRVDNGAALLSRAQGTRKSQSSLDNPTEWESFFNPSVNPAYSKLAAAAGVTGPKDMAAQTLKAIERISRLSKRKGGWAAFVDEHAPDLSGMDRDAIVDMLTTRTAFLRNKIPELRKLTEPAAAERAALPPPKPIHPNEIEAARIDYSIKEPEAINHIRITNSKGYEVLYDYTGSAFRSMNKALYMNPKQLEDAGYSATDLQTLAKKNQTLRDTLLKSREAGHAVEGVVYRGVESWPGLLQEIDAGELTFNAFTSTSISESLARAFSGGDAPVLFRIRQKSAIPIDAMSRSRGEAEALLPPGLRFRVITTKPDPHNGRGRIVDIEEIP